MRLRRIEPVLRRAFRGPCRLPRGAALLVAVSGGADSTALLVALASLAREFDLALHVAHLDHGLRGRASRADADAVRACCERLALPLTAARWDCRARMRRRGLAGEAGLRTLRREFLVRAARRAGAAAIATAHTADDQLETLLMRLARGAGLAGAAGMRPRRGRWLKPLLEATRADVEHDLRRAGVTWREDASNAGPGPLRNRIRHLAVPALLDALQVAPADPVARRAGLARRASAQAAALLEAHRAVAGRARRALRRAAGEAGGARGHALAPLLREPAAVRRAALRRAWRESGDPASPGLTNRQSASLLAALAPRNGAARRAFEVALPRGWRARVAGGRLWFDAPGVAVRRGSPRGRRGRPADARLQGAPTPARTAPAAGGSGRRRGARTSSHALPPSPTADTQEHP